MMIQNAEIDNEYISFCNGFESLTNIKLHLYKEKQMKRRINTYIERKGLTGYQEFINLLQISSSELSLFVDYITINVTSFFRTQEHWKSFEDIVLKPLINNSKPIRIWSSACSTGEEPYSLAMSILSYDNNADFTIFATDIDDNVLKKAKCGAYTKEQISELPGNIIQDFFDIQEERYFVKEKVKKHIEFNKFDLLKDNYPDQFDVIVCRNVLIYFVEEGKDRVYKGFYKSLKPNGCLFTGNTEQIVYYKDYNFKKINNYIYAKGDED